jgi:predicted hydrocarbon binding protein
MIRSRFDWLRDTHPDVDRRSIIDALAEPTKTKFSRGILASDWYDFADLIRLDRAFHERFHGEHPEILKDFGRYSAKANVTSMVNAMAIHEFFRNSAKLHDRFQDFGEASYEQTSDHEGKMIFRNYPSYSSIFCDSAFGFFEQCISMFGGKNVRVTESICQCRGGNSCTFAMSWA